VQRQLAAFYMRKEDWLQAARFYNEALDQNPRLRGELAAPASVANFKAGIQFAGLRDFDWALGLFARALDYDPHLWRARGYVAYVAGMQGDFPRAERELLRIEREHPGEQWTAESLERVRDGLPFVPPPFG
jgi:tetratricopeptide (TPR) repeat protein